MAKAKRKTRYRVQVPMGAMEEIAKQIGCSSGYVARALRYNSETAPSEIRIRDVARKQFGGKEIKIIYTV